VPIVPLELFPDSTSGEVLDIVGGCVDCDSIVSDLNPFPFAGTITNGKEVTTFQGMINNKNTMVTSVVKKISISLTSFSTFCRYMLWMT
jgi:hypothetical protein